MHYARDSEPELFGYRTALQHHDGQPVPPAHPHAGSSTGILPIHDGFRHLAQHIWARRSTNSRHGMSHKGRSWSRNGPQSLTKPLRKTKAIHSHKQEEDKAIQKPASSTWLGVRCACLARSVLGAQCLVRVDSHWLVEGRSRPSSWTPCNTLWARRGSCLLPRPSGLHMVAGLGWTGPDWTGLDQIRLAE
jgi:hypothetical protein